jgi:acyl carrier protein phosphodiesterase
MMSDFVKGNKKFDYQIGIQNGITLHRLIDEFTDNHQATKNAKQIFKQELGLYAGAYTDIVFDYFLANDMNEFKDENALQEFAAHTYILLEDFVDVFPERFLRAFASMKQHNWLLNYRTDYGIQRSFEGLTFRAKYINKEHKAFEIFLENKEHFQVHYDIFFKDVKLFVKNEIHQFVTL